MYSLSLGAINDNSLNPNNFQNSTSLDINVQSENRGSGSINIYRKHK